MDFAVCAVLAAMIIVCALLVYGAKAAERRWIHYHPPDDWDGMREDKQDDEHD